ncbi:MAG: Fe-S cluster assembly protein SufD [Pseudomonadota bacterium]
MSAVADTLKDKSAMTPDVKRIVTTAEQVYLDGFAARKEALPGTAATATRRRAAIASFEGAGLPHRRIEEWKYTDLRALMRDAYPPATGAVASAVPADPLSDGGFDTITVVNGALVGEIPTLDGVTVLPLADALASTDADVQAALAITPARGGNAVLDLNTAFMDHGFVMIVAPGATVETPLMIRSIINAADSATYTNRNAVIVGEGAKLTLVQTFEGDGAAFHRNGTIQINVGDKAEFNHIRLETETDEAVHLSNMIIEIGTEAAYRKYGLSTGASVMRNDLSIRFNGENSTADIASIFLKAGEQHHDTTMYVDHAVPNCTSRELFKSVLGGKSRGVFQGKIMVRPHAQKTDGEMSANAILLTEDAEMDAKPELEIYADDVVCGHGATAGQLDDDLLFFLRARGLPEREAKALLILAFIGEALEAVENEAVHAHMLALTEDWIGKADI